LGPFCNLGSSSNPPYSNQRKAHTSNAFYFLISGFFIYSLQINFRSICRDAALSDGVFVRRSQKNLPIGCKNTLELMSFISCINITGNIPQRCLRATSTRRIGKKHIRIHKTFPFGNIFPLKGMVFAKISLPFCFIF